MEYTAVLRNSHFDTPSNSHYGRGPAGPAAPPYQKRAEII
jgi:hypothetical protein